MMRNNVCFPCLEQPVRCFLTSVSRKKRLSSCPEGKVFTSDNRLSWEEWFLVEDSDGTIKIKSRHHGKMLVSEQEGEVLACSETFKGWDLWDIERAPDGGYLLCSSVHSKYLACNKNDDVYTSSKVPMDESIKWNIEFQTGELCFINQPYADKRLKCDIDGNLSMTDNWKGWEVWRFIEAGDGNVYISSWTHHTKVLCSDKDGNVFTAENEWGDWEKWHVDVAPDGSDGIVIKSVLHNSFLCSDGDIYNTSNTFQASKSSWHLEAAHSQTYFISSGSHDKRIGSNHRSPYTTKNRKRMEEWRVEITKDGLATLFSRAHNKFMGSSYDGKVTMATHAGISEGWKIEPSPYGGIFIVSQAYEMILSCDSKGNLSTIANKGGCCETWSLEPCMPETITKEQLQSRRKSLLIGGATIAASATLMPFAVVGVVGALGFTAGGIAKGSIAAGMMSSAGGSVAAGGTVATLQSIGAAGLGFAGTSVALGAGAALGGSAVGISSAFAKNKECGNSFSNSDTEVNYINKRPFCAWRNW